MSFILDALKKSENERQQQVPAEFVTVPSNPDAPKAPRWLWGLGTLLVVNIVVVVALITRDEVPGIVTSDPEKTKAALQALPEEAQMKLRPTPQSPTSDTEAVPVDDNFADRLDEARRILPERAQGDEPASTVTDKHEESNASGRQPVATARSSTASSLALLPSLDELRLNGEVSLPELHLDIHVFSDSTRDRFVFINMDKYREQDTMSAGPVVREITREGVVLEYRGRRFILPRE